MRILVVEDEDTIAEPLVQGLRREGFEVERVATGEQALAAAPADVVLLDLRLPDLDGYEVCRGLRARSDVPIIMVTARGEEVDRVIGLELGADDYIVKPFGLREVIARIRAVHRRAAGRARRLAPARRRARDRRPRTSSVAGRRTPGADGEGVRHPRRSGRGAWQRRQSTHAPRACLGDDVVRADEDDRRARCVAPPQARRSWLDRDGARHRLPAAPGVSRRILAGYLSLALVVLIALEVPLAVTFRRSEQADLSAKVERDAVAVASLVEDLLQSPRVRPLLSNGSRHATARTPEDAWSWSIGGESRSSTRAHR